MNDVMIEKLPHDVRSNAKSLLEHSPLFRRLLQGVALDECQRLFQPQESASLPKFDAHWFPQVESFEPHVCLQHLRFLKHRAMRHIIWWELGIHGDIETSYHAISETASALLSQAVEMTEHLIAPRFGKLEQHAFSVIGLGKLGGCELNLGSDVDLLFVWQAEGKTQGGRTEVSASEYYNHFSRMVIRLISELTQDGLVWPVDMRLRPGGDGAPICLNLDATLSHYLEYGQTWERAMLIKARSVAGDALLGQDFIQGISPFVYRKYLDYSSVVALADMKRRIDAQAGKQAIEAGFDVKKGRGGIREIEFIIQSLQLIQGGRFPELRQHEGKKALAKLVDAGFLASEEAGKLFQAYLFWRRIEHAIQARLGEQTQTLPNDYENYLSSVLQVQDIQGEMRIYAAYVAAVFAERVLPSISSDAHEKHWLLGEYDLSDTALDESEKQSIQQALQQMDKQLLRGILPERSRAQVEHILHIAMPVWLKHRYASYAIQAFADLLHSISGRATWVDLLATHKGTLDWLIGVLSASRYLSSHIIKNPAWLEWPLENERGEVEISRLCQQLDALVCDDEALFLRELGQWVDQARLHCALHINADKEGPLIIGGWLADVADAVSRACLRATLLLLNLPEDFAFVALALGKHGSREMGLVSDLDMVFVVVEDPLLQVNGRSAREWAQRIGRRMIRQITGAPPFGAGYEFDARLRPSGQSGALVVTLEGFKDYQQHEAQTWEHQALCRARAVTGSPQARQQVTTLIENVLAQPRDFKALAGEVRAMRQKMLQHLASHDEHKINLKHDKGGLVDIEFLAQFARLMFGGKAKGTVEILKDMPSHAPELWLDKSQQLADVYMQYRQMENILRVELWQSIGKLSTNQHADEWLALGQRTAIISPEKLKETMQQVHGIFIALLQLKH
ncbi:MAG: bifunctional [glutamate--ammonia ligase]-adenylyl-L-tyrosine phosphorylase/[glutamate--ammonia-ligase] adenylyltransferase [Ghiorsea sp.]|nr:bifunctional [glutamate--ammonia ligase]-adenylyl-L-tyrosine phosphorylase/[glutamate--ammonia-ligase] adenylyltransferase [Ghiorsea sp.]